MDTRQYKSESESGGTSVAFLNESEATNGCRKDIVTRITQTRQGRDFITERHLNGRADSRTWIRYRDGIAGTRKYTDDLNTEWQGPFSVQVGQKP